LKRVDLAGGVTTLTDEVAAGVGDTWNREGIILTPAAYALQLTAKTKTAKVTAGL
jgi:hypothetical protein